MRPTLIFEFDAGDAIQELCDAIDDHIRRALVRTVSSVAHTARETHSYENRTGDLEAGTRGSNILDGDLWSDTLEGEVLGETSYGSILEDNPRWAFLAPAWDANEAFAADDLDRALGDAARAAGW